jgi:hypothetical protein
MKLLGLLTLVIAFLGSMAQAVPLKVIYQDIKLPTQRVLERNQFTAPIASSTTYIVASAAGATSAAVATLSTFTHQPDVARNLEITPATNVANVGSCTLTVTGTDINGHALSEDFAFSAGSGTKQVGNKAFKTVTLLSWAASCEASTYNVTWAVGVGNKLGLKRCMDNAGDFFHSITNGTKDTSLATIASNRTVVGSNTIQFNSAPDASKIFVVYYVQNYLCF